MKRILCAGVLVVGLMLALPISSGRVWALPTPLVVADAKGDACAGVGLTAGNNGCGDSGAQVNTAVTNIVNIMAAVAGAVAIIMILAAAFKFMTASGDPSGITSARRALVYALIGAVIAGSAESIVHFVLSRTL